MKPSPFLIITLAWLLKISAVLAQNPVNINLTEKEGLPDREFYNVAEDSEGLIWLAGNKGLTKFDGTAFTTLEHPEKRGLSLFQLQIDEEDKVWSINISGQLFYAEKGKLNLYSDLKTELRGSLPSIKVTSKNVIVSTDFVIIIFNKASKTKKVINISKSGLPFGYPIVSDDTIYLIKDDQLFTVVNNMLKKISTLDLNLRKDSSKRIGIVKIEKLPDGTLLVYTHNENRQSNLYRIKNGLATPVVFPAALEGLRIELIKLIDEDIWFLTGDGAYRSNYKNGSFKIKNHFLKGYFTTDITKDMDANLWFSTIKNGVYVLPNIHVKTIAFPNSFEQPTRLANGKKDEIIAGFSNGDVLHYNTKTKVKTVIDLPGVRAISSLVYDSFNEQYLYFQDIDNYSAKATNPSDYKKTTIKLVAVKDLTTIDQKKIAYANSGEVAIKTYLQNNSLPTIDKNLFSKKKRGYTAYKNKVINLVYFATVDDLIAVDDNYTETQITTIDGNNILANSITQTQDGSIWVATFTNGIYQINGTTIVGHFTTKNGLLSNRTTAIAGHANDLWIATDAGLQLLVRSQNVQPFFKALKKQDGIPSYDIKDIAIIKDTAYFSSPTALFSVEKNLAFKAFKEPKLYFTKININKTVQPLKDRYKINETESNLVVGFNANGFRGFSNGNYKYRLKGYDDEWVVIKQGVNEIQFASLPSGSFKFQLAPISKKPNTESIISFSLEVVKPFYKTFVFWGLLMGLIVASIVLYYKKRLKKKEQQREKENARLHLASQLTELKLENLQSQMNPHFIFNALNSIQEYIVHNEKDLASNYLVKFSRLIRMYLDQSRKNSISLAEEVDAMTLYLQLEKLRFEDSLSFFIDVQSTVATTALKVPPLFIQPYVENALKHGLLHRKTNRKLHVTFEYNDGDNNLIVIVEDNGIGRDAALAIKKAYPQYHTSFATYAINQRVDLLNKNRTSKISVHTDDLFEGETAIGTRISIQIPQEV